MPWRKAKLRNFVSSNNAPLGVLFYHRVADESPNAWTMSCKDFARQLDWLQENFDVVSLGELQSRMRLGKSDTPAVAITFDDGYAENTDFAIPELVRRELTATYFVSTDFVESGQGFPHDIAAGRELAPNTIEQLKAYQAQGIEIGAHTRSHLDCGQTDDPMQLRNEIIGSIERLEDWLSSKIQFFAFPYGLPENMSQLAVDTLVDSGIQGFCSAYGAWNWPKQNHPFHIKRIHADPGIELLKNWLTLDPRKLTDKVELPFELPPIEEMENSQDSDSQESQFPLTNLMTPVDVSSPAPSQN